jgi:hypothetical protein
MSDQDDWEFAGPDDAKTETRAAVVYLLRGATGRARGDIVQEIIAGVCGLTGAAFQENADNQNGPASPVRP